MALHLLERIEQILCLGELRANKSFKFLKSGAPGDQAMHAFEVGVKTVGGEQAAFEDLFHMGHQFQFGGVMQLSDRRDQAQLRPQTMAIVGIDFGLRPILPLGAGG